MAFQISRILHAGYVFESGGVRIAFDPIFENPFSHNCFAYPNVKFDLEKIRHLHFDAVFISHFHDDHFSLESLDLLDRRTPIYFYCLFEELFSMIREMGFQNIQALQTDVQVQIGEIQITPRRALDAEVDSIFHIQAKGLNVLNVVDAWLDPETLPQLAQAAPWDLVLWPFQTMLETDVLAPRRAPQPSLELPPEWIEQLRLLNPRFVVPSSCQFIHEPWSWFNDRLFPISYQQFAKEVRSAFPATRVVRLNPGVSVTLNSQDLMHGEPLSWILPVGEQDVDYHYQADLVPPSTSEIAKHFPSLSNEQTKKVLEYCRSGLIEKYNRMEPPQDPYFEKLRHWRLSLYDDEGQPRHFHYRLQLDRLEALEDSKEPLSWTTEIPISKLYAALELGESLTSLYIRINDLNFSPEIEKEMQFTDVVEDPLIRCLFNGRLGSYQAAQLKRIKERHQI